MRALSWLSFAVGVVPALIHSPTQAQVGKPVVPIDAFVRADQYAQPRLSPDGKRLVVTARVQLGKRTIPVLNFYNLSDMKLLSTVRVPLYSVPLNYLWVSDTRLVVNIGMEVGSRERPQATGEVMAVDVDGGQQRYLFGYKMDAYPSQGNRYAADYASSWTVFTPLERNNHFYLGTQMWDHDRSMLYDLDSRSGIRKLLASIPTPFADFVVQNNGVPRFAMGTDKDNWYQLWRYDDAASKWAEVNLKDGGATYPFSFSADDQQYLAKWSNDGGPLKIIRAAVAGGAHSVLAEDPAASIDTLMYASSRTTPVAAVTSIGRPRVIYLEPDHRDVAVHQKLSAQFADSLVLLGGGSDDGSKMIMTVHSDRDPGVFYLYDRATNRADELFVTMDGIDPDQMAPRRPISFKARDGKQIDGYLTMPKTVPGHKPPLVLLPHGGPHGVADEWFFDTDAQFLASRGYAVLQVNFRGSGGRGRAFQMAGYRQWGGKILDDLVDGVQWTVAQGEVDGSRMCAYGASFGAYAALMLAAREPDLFKCAIGYAGVYEPALIVDGDNARSSSRLQATFKRYLGTDAAELARYSPVQRAASIKAGVLLIHGGKDERAPKEHAFKMKAALEKAGRAPEWYYVDYEGHGFYDTENQTEVYKRLEAFLGKYLGKP